MAQFPNTTAADGIWTLKKVRRAILGDNWPPLAPPDQFFADTVLLLQADDLADGSQNNTFLDSSTNAHTITRNGNATQGSFSPFSQDEGKWGNYFDGTDDSLSIATNSELDWGTSTDFTMECWFYSDVSITFNTAVMTTRAINSPFTGLLVGINGSTNYVQVYFGTPLIITGSTAISASQWYHIAVTRTGGTIELFVNGVSEGTDTTSRDIQNIDGVRIGDALASTTSFGSPTGYISNARIVSGTAVYTSAFTPPTEPLTAITNTSLLTCQSNRFVDNSSNAHSITVNGTPKVTPFSPFAPSTAYNPATKGGSADFDGTGDYLQVAGDSSFNLTGDFTVEFWIYNRVTPQSFQAFFGIQPSSGSTGGLRISNQSPGTTFRLIAGEASFSTDIDGDPLKVNAWSHLAMTRSGSTVRAFINGVLQATDTDSGWVGTNLPATIGAGRNAATPYELNVYDASFSNVRILNGTAVYTSNFTPPNAPVSEVSGTSLLCNFTNAGIYDGTGRNVLETVGDAQVDTAVKKYGTGSMQFDGTGDELVIPNSENFVFGTGDFTIEMWAYFNDSSPSSYLFDSRPASTNGAYPTIYVSSTSTLIYVANGASQITGPVMSGSQWYHIAVSRSGTSTKMFVDGTQVGSTYTDSTNYVSSTPKVGGGAFTLNHNGYIDDFRITKGVARYTANFTPPAAKLEQQ